MPDLNALQFANPIRLMYMMAAIWHLAQDHGGRPMNILEVGSWLGASALTWGHALALHNGSRGRITCLDAWAPFIDHTVNEETHHKKMESAFVDGSAYDTFLNNVALIPNGIDLAVLRGLSGDILPTLPTAGFDVVYIDGDHSYPVVHDDIRCSMKLVADGGILCGDDLELQTHEVNAEIARQQPSLEHAFAVHLSRSYHPGVTLAVGELLGRVSAWEGFWAMRKRGASWQPISLDGAPLDMPPHLPPRSMMELKIYLMQHGLM
jgi:predicted O-methyltransferase YrrM